MSSASLQTVLESLGTLQGNAQQTKVLRHLMQCQTAALDGVAMHCEDCQHDSIRYHSCRDRHCPRCGYHAQQRWSNRMQMVALPVTYYHVVFTLPHTLNAWVRRYPRQLYQTLFEAVWATMKQFGHDKKRLNGQIGMTAVLHTWGQQLNQHVHLHCLVPGGALTQDNQWRRAKSNYLFPVKALARVYRAKMVTALRQLVDNGCVEISQSATQLNQLMQQSWNVYSKPCIQKTATVIKYLGRYSHRVALNDSRLLDMDDTHVTLKYKDYHDKNRHKTLQLTHAELIRRFKMHILPRGFMRIRHYGIMGNRCRQQSRDKILAALQRKEPIVEHKDKEVIVTPYYCSKCGSTHVTVSSLPEEDSG